MSILDIPSRPMNDPRELDGPLSDGICADPTCGPQYATDLARCEECGPLVKYCKDRHLVNQGDFRLCVAHSTYQPPEAWRKQPPVERAAHVFACFSGGKANQILVAERMSDDDIAAGAKLMRDERTIRERYRTTYGDTRFGTWPPDVSARLRVELSELRNRPVRVVDAEHPLREGEMSELLKDSIEHVQRSA